MNFLIRTSVYLFICTLIISCAQVVAPGGGPIDRIPPKALKYAPDSAQLNFNSRGIEINFDEFIQLHDLNSQLIISPPLQYTPEIQVKGKSLVIELDKNEVLKPNTTYAINFGNAVQDFHENNPKENFKYIFSTGTYIDSLSIKGKVQNAFNNTTEKGITVMLYSDKNDSVVYKKQPDYFTKTAANGTFQLNNVRAGTYKIIALKDANANYKYDGESESIGFIDVTVNPSDKKSIVINIFQEAEKKFYLKKYLHDSYGKISFVFNRGNDSIKIIPINATIPDDQLWLGFSKEKDTLNYWIKKFEKDSLKLQIKNGNKIIDTVELQMIKKEEALKSKKNPLKLKLSNNFNGNQSFDLGKEIRLFFSQPIESINEGAGVLLKEDSIPVKNLFFYKTPNKNNILLCRGDTYMPMPGQRIPSNANIIDLKENTKYHLLILPGTFTDIFGLTNDSIKIDFKTKEEKYYGNIALKINIPETKDAYIIQLLDEKQNVIDERFDAKTLNYKYLYPQNYKLKIIYDRNNNHKWDSGDYIKKQQPEKVIYYKELINVRSNWDLDLDWKVNE